MSETVCELKKTHQIIECRESYRPRRRREIILRREMEWNILLFFILFRILIHSVVAVLYISGY